MDHTVTRRRLPTDRPGISHRAIIAGHRVYIRTGEYEDGTLGEFFIEASQAGSTLSALLDAWAVACSIALQYGVPLSILAGKFVGYRFEPAGVTDNVEIREAQSIIDYVMQWLAGRYA